MIALLQRVSQADVVVNNKTVGEINHGLLALIGIERGDTRANADKLLTRLLSYRVFSDQQNKMNLSLQDIDGGLLLVPQFTLAANTDKGKRPSFSSAESPEKSQQLFNYLVQEAKQAHTTVQTGEFGADMAVSLINDGPVTFWLQVKPENL